MITHTIKNIYRPCKPDVVMNTTRQMIEKKKQGHTQCGWLPVISYAPRVQNKKLFGNELLNTAEASKIRFQPWQL